MQTITNENDQITITVTDDQYPYLIATKNLSLTSKEVYLEIYNTLRKELNKNLVFYVNPYLQSNEWGLGLRGLDLDTNLGSGNRILWITPYFRASFHNCICLTYSHFEKLRKSPHFSLNRPNNYSRRFGLCHFAGYKVFEKTYNLTGRWIFIYIDTTKNFDKVVELIKDIGIWNWDGHDTTSNKLFNN